MAHLLRLENLWAELRFKQLVLEEPGDGFQRFFQRIMKAVDGDDFVAVRPKGRFGDFKCDGWSVASNTCYAVYGPFTRKSPGQIEAKIRSDFEGALNAWPEMKQWRFVHNDIYGLDPAVSKSIVTLRKKLADHPSHVSILPPWNPADLWSYLREAEPTARESVLGSSGWYTATTDLDMLVGQDLNNPIVTSACASILQLIDGYSAGCIVDPLTATAYSATLSMYLLGERDSFENRYSLLNARCEVDPFETMLASTIFCAESVWLWTDATLQTPEDWAALVNSTKLTIPYVTDIVLDAICGGNPDGRQMIPGHPDDQAKVAMNLGPVAAHTLLLTAAARSTYPACVLQDLFIRVQRADPGSQV
ncbi:hypothetical protein [Mycobacteroides abscessus]|uniref:hypothetical protein n=1 Tax=Mycobacteroides abscessus TaxID=36809 RepID=UPI0019D13F83|nr:hypothetical protein [Mycobacteroides abscessus]MBN7559264.1 hypothetical protein [Mycobacteroides abscessus subsp. abscessus]